MNKVASVRRIRSWHPDNIAFLLTSAFGTNVVFRHKEVMCFGDFRLSGVLLHLHPFVAFVRVAFVRCIC